MDGEQTPRVDGENITFEWRGSRAPLLMGDFTEWMPEQGLPMQETRPGVWTASVKLLPESYVEYLYLLDGKPNLDPANPRRVSNGMGGQNNYFYMPGASPTPLARRRRGVPAGEVTRHMVRASFTLTGSHSVFLYNRPVYLYQPPVSEPCPLVVVFDGGDYLRRARLPTIVDNLIGEGRIRPVALAMLPNGGKNRVIEYTCSESTQAFVLQNVLPLAAQKLNLVDVAASPGAYGVLGASLGGLTALYTGLRSPQIFGRVLSQSGAFDPVFVVDAMVRQMEVQPLKVWMDVGRYEFLYRGNQEMHALLAGRGYDVAYREYRGGHNYSAWRDDVWRGLEWLFGK